MSKSPVTTGTVEIWLSRETADADWRVINASLGMPKHRQRLLPNSPSPIQDIFVPKAADVLTHHLNTVSETAVFSKSDFSLTLPGLRIRGLRILSRVAPDGSATASVRFVQTEGELNSLIQPQMRTGATAPPVNIDALTIPVLEDLLRPALEVIDHVLDNGLSEEDARVLAARVKIMRSKRDELADYVSLLTRYTSTMAFHPSPLLTPEQTIRIEAANNQPSRAISWNPTTGATRGESGSILHGHHTGEHMHS
ncbi:hypothetical protein [Antarctobacter jejuensis]|uniref:hypothetical protein n=1 Tax=Antarctobacter jejuensis TaxID=1439938 RepID=UPI003FD1F402